MFRDWGLTCILNRWKQLRGFRCPVSDVLVFAVRGRLLLRISLTVGKSNLAWAARQVSLSEEPVT